MEKLNFNITNQVRQEQLEEQTKQMLSISSRFLSEYEMARYVRPYQDQCFAIFFMGRVIGKVNTSAVVTDPMNPSSVYVNIFNKLKGTILDSKSQELVQTCHSTMNKLFALGIHVSNVEAQKVKSDVIRIESRDSNNTYNQS